MLVKTESRIEVHVGKFKVSLVRLYADVVPTFLNS